MFASGSWSINQGQIDSAAVALQGQNSITEADFMEALKMIIILEPRVSS